MADYGLGGGFNNNDSMGGGSGLSLGGGGLGFGGTNSSDGYGIGGGSGSGLGFSGGGDASSSGYDFGYNPTFSDYSFSPSTNFSLDSIYGQDTGLGLNQFGSVGLSFPSSGTSTGLGLGGNEPGETSFWDGNMGKFLKGLGMFAINTNPLGRALSTAYGVGKAATSGNYGQAVGGLVGAATGNGLLGTAAGLGTDAMMGKDVGDKAKTALGSGFGAALGGSMAGPVGGYVGGTLGAAAARTAPAGTSSPTNGDTSGKMGLPELAAATLGSLWLNNQASKDAKTAANAMSVQNVQNQLSEMFGPNSSYAQTLKQELERKDAAAGRRSQYGAREVELQARLAQLQAQSAPGLINAYTTAAQQQLAAAQAKRAKQAQMLSGLYALGKDSGALNSLNNLFSQPSLPSVDYSLPSSGGYYGLQAPSTSSGDLYSLF